MKIKILSFSLFDSGETILGALVFSTFFPLYITKFIDPKIYSYAYSFAFLLSFFFALEFGKLADRFAIRKHLFVVFVIITTVLTFLLSFTVKMPDLSLFLFVLMAISHQQSFVFYNSLLLDFPNKGIASGIGVSFGYIGSAFALIFLANSLSIPWVYVIAGAIFALFAFPSILILENPKEKSSDISLSGIFRDRRFLLTILSVLSITEVANTLIAIMSIYLKKVFGFEDVYIYKIIGFSAIGGIMGGIVWGYLSDKFSPKRIFPIGFIIWIFVLLSIGFVDHSTIILFGFIVGVSLAHLWTVSRVYIISEFPAHEVSTRMSFLSLTERVASTTGLFIWGSLLYITSDNYPLSASLMVVFPLIGLLMFILSKRVT